MLRNAGPPVLVYAGRWAFARRDELRERGATDVMASREALYASVLEILGRSPEPEDGAD